MSGDTRVAVPLTLLPPVNKLKTKQKMVQELVGNNNIKNNKLFIIMYAVVKVKRLEIKVKEKLNKIKIMKKLIHVANSTPVNSSKMFEEHQQQHHHHQQQQQQQEQDNTKFSLSTTSRNSIIPSNNSSHLYNRSTNQSRESKLMQHDFEVNGSNKEFTYLPLKPVKLSNTENRVKFIGQIKTHKKASLTLEPKQSAKLSMQSQSISALDTISLIKHNINLKNDDIYGDKKLKMSGKNVLPKKLTKDLKKINHLVSMADALNINSTRPITNDKYKKIPPNVTDLQVLDLSQERRSNMNFPLLQIPQELFKLKQLKRLHFDCNNIKIIPDEFGSSLINLEILTFSNNRLKTLPKTFKNLIKLQSLHLSHNKFDLFPMVLCEIPKLRFLDLSTNQIQQLPEQIDSMRNLESLLLFHNELKILPSAIGNLFNLRTLWLGENKLTELPKEIKYIADNLADNDLDSFSLSSNILGNPLVKPPMEICLKGYKAIKRYFDEFNTEQQVEFNQA